MIFDLQLFSVGLGVSALVMSLTVLWYVARRSGPLERRAIQHTTLDILAGEVNDLRIAVAEAARALELATPDRTSVEASAVPYTLLFAQRFTIKMLMQVIERLTAAQVKVGAHENDPA